MDVCLGAQFGTVFSLPLSGLLSRYGFAGGWPSIFYVFGAVGTVWSVAFLIWVYEDPDSHPRIRDSERKFITGSLGGEKTEQVCYITWRVLRLRAHAASARKHVGKCSGLARLLAPSDPMLSCLSDATYPMDVGAQVDALLGHPGRPHGPELRL